jgi:hypothetical protein
MILVMLAIRNTVSALTSTPAAFCFPAEKVLLSP